MVYNSNEECQEKGRLRFLLEVLSQKEMLDIENMQNILKMVHEELAKLEENESIEKLKVEVTKMDEFLSKRNFARSEIELKLWVLIQKIKEIA